MGGDGDEGRGGKCRRKGGSGGYLVGTEKATGAVVKTIDGSRRMGGDAHGGVGNGCALGERVGEWRDGGRVGDNGSGERGDAVDCRVRGSMGEGGRGVRAHPIHHFSRRGGKGGGKGRREGRSGGHENCAAVAEGSGREGVGESIR